MLFENLLIYTLMFPIFGILLLLFIPSSKKKLLKMIALNFSCLSCISSLFLWGFFQKSTCSFQFVIKFLWLSNLNLNFTLGVDGISLFFVLLTTLLIPLCILTSWNSISHSLKEFLIAFLFLDFLLIGTFCVLDLLFLGVILRSLSFPCLVISQALKHDFFRFLERDAGKAKSKATWWGLHTSKNSWQVTSHKVSTTYIGPADILKGIGSIVGNGTFEWWVRSEERCSPIITHSQRGNESFCGFIISMCGHGVTRNLWKPKRGEILMASETL